MPQYWPIIGPYPAAARGGMPFVGLHFVTAGMQGGGHGGMHIGAHDGGAEGGNG